MQSNPKIALNSRQLCDLELLLDGSYSPLQGYMNEDEYQSVLSEMKLQSGQLFALPIYLAVEEKLLNQHNIQINSELTLVDHQSYPLVNLQVQSIYKPDLKRECHLSLGTDDINHPYVPIVLEQQNCKYIGGKFTYIFSPPKHYDYIKIRKSPREIKQIFQQNNYSCVVGFQTRNPMHRSHYELSKYALKATDNASAVLFLNPVVGVTQQEDLDYHLRVRCYEKLLDHYAKENIKVFLNLLNLSMRMAGPREVIHHAIIRQNYGCTHFVVGRDHAGPSSKKQDGTPFYSCYEARDMALRLQDQLKIKIIPGEAISYVESSDTYFLESELPKGVQTRNISGTDLREMLRTGKQIPAWFTFPDIGEELALDFKQTLQKGFCVYICGLSAAGKSTLMAAIDESFKEVVPRRTVSCLDADEIRTHLSKGLGFSKEDRSTNVQRIGYVASQIVKHGGIALVANIAPYKEDRQHNRKAIASFGGYIQVFIDATVEVCAERDPKQLYKKAALDNSIKLTGVSDPFERPEESELILDGNISTQQQLASVLQYLQSKGYL